MFNMAGVAWDYDKQAHSSQAYFTAAVQRQRGNIGDKLSYE